MTITAPGQLAALLREPDYRRVWLVGACTGTSRWLEMLVVGVYAFEVTGSPFLVALLVIIRLVPLTLFGSLVGTLADRYSPRLFLITALGGAAIVSAAVFALLASGLAQYWIVVVASLASGLVWTADMPLRRRMLGDIAGKDRLVPALSLDSATNNATRMVGPFVGGILYQWLGAAGAFAVTTGLYLLAAILISRIRIEAPEPGERPAAKILSELGEGFRFALRDRDVLKILLVTIAFNIWGLPFLAMIPVIGSEELGLGAGWIGALAALEGAGGFLGALAIAVRPPSVSFRRLYFFGALGYVVFAFLAGWMAYALPMAAVLFAVGLASAGFSSMQSTLVYSAAPPHMRSRLFGLLVICIGTGLVGVLNMGLMGEWFGGATAVRIVAAEGMVALALIALGWPELRSRGGT